MKIAHLLSGGVDSSVALSLLEDEGHDITAYYIKIWLEDDMFFLGDCPWEEDLKYAKAVCEQLNIPLKTISLQQEYFDTVVEYAIEELKAGRTPSPDIFCNQKIKFGMFFARIGEGYDKISSGHYAQIEESPAVSRQSLEELAVSREQLAVKQEKARFLQNDNIEIVKQVQNVTKIENDIINLESKIQNSKFYLKQSPDEIKDQTYFLAYLSQEQLSRILFPIGNYTKKEVRKIALEKKLATKNRKDSQGICFLGKIKYNDFIKFHLGEKKGEIINIDNSKVIGHHKGYWYHTIGQRQGLGLGGGPWYVVKKDIDNNIIFVSNKKDSLSVPRDRFIARNINWIPEPPAKNHLQVKLRHGKRKYKCSIELLDDKSAKVMLDGIDEGIAPGQFSIFYDEGYCIGGGVIYIDD